MLKARSLSFLRLYFTKRLFVIGLLGFSSGLPLLLTMSTLSWWMAKDGLDKKTIGMFALASLPYGYKFLWAPLIDRLKVPFLSKTLGHRRSWLLLSQIFLACSLLGVGMQNPLDNIMGLAVMSFLVAFWSATQDIVVDAYRIESLSRSEYAAGAAMEVNGYRLGMMVAGAGALMLSDYFSWSLVYIIMASMMGVGIITTFWCTETPSGLQKNQQHTSGSYWSDLKATYAGPLLDFVSKPGWALSLLFIFLFKVGDNFIVSMSTVFYQETGFTGVEIGTVTKIFGVWMTVLGSFFVGGLSYRYGIMKALLIVGVLHLLSHGFLLILACVGKNIPLLYLTVASDHVTNGMVTGVFVAYLSSLCSREYTATQYALLSSLMSQTRIFSSSAGGWIAAHTNWVSFFGIAMVASVPGLLLVMYLMRRYPMEKDSRR